MTHKQFLRRLLASVAVVTFGVILTGCPDPDSWLYFDLSGKWTQTPRLVLSPKVRLQFSIDGGYSTVHKKYVAYLYWGDQSYKKDSMEVNPCLVSIQLNCTMMTYEPVGPESKRDGCWQPVDGHQEFSYTCAVDSTVVPRDSLGRYLSLPFSIYLGDAFRVRGRAIPIDTMHAVDRKTQRPGFPQAWRKRLQMLGL
jgi:hypothetical protein